MPGDNFRRHPVGSSDHRVALGPVGGDLCAEAKVGHFDLAVDAQQHVVRLDVAMNYFLQQTAQQ